jgi:hypothetical protein
MSDLRLSIRHCGDGCDAGRSATQIDAGPINPKSNPHFFRWRPSTRVGGGGRSPGSPRTPAATDRADPAPAAACIRPACRQARRSAARYSTPCSTASATAPASRQRGLGMDRRLGITRAWLLPCRVVVASSLRAGCRLKVRSVAFAACRRRGSD